MGISRFSAALAILPALSASLHAQSSLEITSPASGTVVYPGHVVGVTVSASGPPLENVTVIGSDPIGFTKILNAPPYQFDVEIPARITPGQYRLSAMGTSHSSPPANFAPILSEPITIDVERPDLPVKITADSRQLGLNVGDRMPIRVYGTFTDGSVVDMSKSTQTTFVSQAPGIATVTGEGLVTAVAPGSTAIVIARFGSAGDDHRFERR
ncbi:MAG: Ig-like domain-containing protein [Bryobacteraceae bacterium]